MSITNKHVVAACWVGVIILQALSLFIDKLHSTFTFLGIIFSLGGISLFFRWEKEHEALIREQEYRIEDANKKIEKQESQLTSVAKVNEAFLERATAIASENSELRNLVSDRNSKIVVLTQKNEEQKSQLASAADVNNTFMEQNVKLLSENGELKEKLSNKISEIGSLKEKIKPPKLAWDIPITLGPWEKRRALYLALMEIEEKLKQSPLDFIQAKAILESDEKYLSTNPVNGKKNKPTHSIHMDTIRDTYFAGKDGFWVNFDEDVIRVKNNAKVKK